MNSGLASVLKDLSAYLAYLQDEGVLTVEVAPRVVERLRVSLAAPEPEGHVARAEPAPPAGRARAPEPTQLELIAGEIGECAKCELHGSRTNVVPGQGSPSPDIMFIGEAPGHDEDRSGQAFVGRAGKLLTQMIEAMGYTREQVFIANILKCRPPGNRNPYPHEMETCLPYLLAQIRFLRPKVIIALGATAVKGLMQTEQGITRLRGQWMSFEGIDLMPTYHPAYLLRNPAAKKDAWKDLQDVLRRLGRPIPPVKKRSGT